MYFQGWEAEVFVMGWEGTSRAKRHLLGMGPPYWSVLLLTLDFRNWSAGQHSRVSCHDLPCKLPSIMMLWEASLSGIHGWQIHKGSPWTRDTYQ